MKTAQLWVIYVTLGIFVFLAIYGCIAGTKTDPFIAGIIGSVFGLAFGIYLKKGTNGKGE